MFRTYEAVTNAAREGARVGVLPGTTRLMCRRASTPTSAPPGLTGPRTTTVTNVPVATPAGTFTARSVVVNYTYQFAFMGGFAPFFGGTFSTINLTRGPVMRTETQAAAP